MTLPILLSVPHAGLRIPREVEHLNLLSLEEIVSDGDEGAAEIYDLASEVSVYVSTDIARPFVDLNRPEDDRRKDGVVKTHTCWDVPIYKESLSEDLVESLLDRYYRPFHQKLQDLSNGVKLGIDCHTMAQKGPPVGPDPGKERPLVCLSNADGTCPMEWMRHLSALFEVAFQTSVSINKPFKGGHIIRSHSKEIPWMQLELSRTPSISNQEKRQKVIQVLKYWYG